MASTLLVYAGKKAILGTLKSYTFPPRNTLILEHRIMWPFLCIYPYLLIPNSFTYHIDILPLQKLHLKQELRGKSSIWQAPSIPPWINSLPYFDGNNTYWYSATQSSRPTYFKVSCWTALSRARTPLTSFRICWMLSM